MIRDTVFKVFGTATNAEIHALKEELTYLAHQLESSEVQLTIPDIPEVPDKEWAGTPDNPYTPELGSEQLHELHAEMDLRISDLLKELEYEQKQKAFVEEASKGIVFSEDAEVLAKQLAQKTKIEVAE